MKLEALDHPKTLDFAARLNVELPAAIGHLELLWAFTAKKAPRGNIGKWPDGAIARACYWNSDPALFVNALTDAGFLDPHGTHRYLVHDWQDHAMGWVRAKLKKTGQTFISSTNEPTSEPSLEGTLEPTSEPTQGREAKGSQGKPREVKRHNGADAPLPDGLDVKAWENFLDYRKQIRKPLKPASIPAAQRKLAAFGCDQAAVVEQTIANGWQGLFPLKQQSQTKSQGKIYRAIEAVRRSNGTA